MTAFNLISGKPDFRPQQPDFDPVACGFFWVDEMSLPEPYYQDETCTIYNADCKDILPHLGSFDLLLTDPPYGYEWNTNYSRFSKGSTDKEAIKTMGMVKSILSHAL